ncbi:uncharacterized protein LOC128992691 [Macrosteles quadrilineatus]|uniref:uncharacterized protein LOC128992691 n=1 Tax=Macrosteles quadrilineatus TaxID=74068 RepID=UPI0023E100AA|nr:uncharacterized protein LOC128992691 [Macrosteles quadrilineatus]
MEDPVGVLEDRVRLLELRVFGESQGEDVALPQSSAVDSLLEVQRVVSSALSGREKITAAVKRLDQLEAVLDPMFEDSVIDSAAKVAFILSMESHLEEVTRQLVRLKELSPSLESEQLRNIPLLLRQLAKLTTTMVEQREKYELVDDGIQDLVSRYTEVINGITAVFATLDNLVTELEIKALPKPVID